MKGLLSEEGLGVIEFRVALLEAVDVGMRGGVAVEDGFIELVDVKERVRLAVFVCDDENDGVSVFEGVVRAVTEEEIEADEVIVFEGEIVEDGEYDREDVKDDEAVSEDVNVVVPVFVLVKLFVIDRV